MTAIYMLTIAATRAESLVRQRREIRLPAQLHIHCRTL